MQANAGYLGIIGSNTTAAISYTVIDSFGLVLFIGLYTNIAFYIAHIGQLYNHSF